MQIKFSINSDFNFKQNTKPVYQLWWREALPNLQDSHLVPLLSESSTQQWKHTKALDSIRTPFTALSQVICKFLDNNRQCVTRFQPSLTSTPTARWCNQPFTCHRSVRLLLQINFTTHSCHTPHCMTSHSIKCNYGRVVPVHALKVYGGVYVQLHTFSFMPRSWPQHLDRDTSVDQPVVQPLSRLFTVESLVI
jgi:hypothetical protein